MPIDSQDAIDLIAAATTLKTTFETKADDIDAAVANVVADAADIADAKTDAQADAALVAAAKSAVDDDAAAIATAINDINDAIIPKLPVYNMLRDSGRFATISDLHANVYSSSFTAEFSGFVGYNGCVISDGGKYTTNSSTNGGSRAAIPQAIVDLLVSLGDAGRRYGTEFNIAECTAGTGTGATAIESHYIMFAANGGAFIGPTNKASISFWVRVTAGTAWLGEGSRHAVDGETVVGDTELLIADGWQHVSATIGSGIGYISSGLPNIYGVDGTVVEIALPVMVPGDVLLPVHTHPVATLRT